MEKTFFGFRIVEDGLKLGYFFLVDWSHMCSYAGVSVFLASACVLLFSDSYHSFTSDNCIRSEANFEVFRRPNNDSLMHKRRELAIENVSTFFYSCVWTSTNVVFQQPIISNMDHAPKHPRLSTI